MMRIVPLGGGSEIGACSLLIEIDGTRVLVDAGTRWLAGPSPLPDLIRLEREGGVDVALVTHAHPDNIGALPLIHRGYPSAQVIATEPTLELINKLLCEPPADGDPAYSREPECPAYPQETLDSLRGKSQAINFFQEVRLPGGRLTVTAYPAGHALGAAAYILSGSSGTVLLAGGIGSANLLTFPPVKLPRCLADVVVVYGADGGRHQLERAQDELDLAQLAVEAIADRQGKLLFPVIPGARTTEIVAVLQRAMIAGKLPRVPVYLDGLAGVAAVVYGNNTPYQSEGFERLSGQYGNALFSRLPNFQLVESADMRQKLVAGPPCIIIASSSTLRGGPAHFYARSLADGEQNTIAFSAYDDEESAGLDVAVADGQPPRLPWPARCRIAAYRWPIHASDVELCGQLARLRPTLAVFTGGTSERSAELARQLSLSWRCDMAAPANGDTVLYDVERKIPRQPRFPTPFGLGWGRPLDAKDVPRLRQAAVEIFDAGRPIFLPDLLRLWYGEGRFGSAQLRTAVSVLDAAPSFRRVPIFPILYMIPSDEPEGRLPAAAARALIQEFLPGDALPQRITVDEQAAVITLGFDFPAIAADRYATAINVLTSITGWRFKIDPREQPDLIIAAVRDILNDPAVQVEFNGKTGAFSAVIEQIPAADIAAMYQREFGRRTGRRLVFLTPSEVAEATKALEQGAVDGGRLEINKAFAMIDAAFAAQRFRPLRRGQKTDGDDLFIEIAFITPELGQRFVPLIAELAQQTGWPIRLRAVANQDRLSQLAVSMLPNSWELARHPSVLVKLRAVRLTFKHSVDQTAFSKIADRFREETGWTMEQIPGDNA